MFAMTIVVSEVPQIAYIFQFVQLSALQLMLAVILGLLIIPIVEAAKFIQRHF